jgi:hypothetical protein
LTRKELPVATRAEQALSRDLDLYGQFWDIVREGQDVPKAKAEPSKSWTFQGRVWIFNPKSEEDSDD